MKTVKTILVCFMAALGFAASAYAEGRGLVISEAVPYNGTYARQNKEYYDWVELKNDSDEAVRLEDYYLSDSRKDLQKFRLPEAELKPGGLYIIFCSGDESLTTSRYVHAPFSISCSGEKLYLSDAEGNIVDMVNVKDVPLYGSIGRKQGEEGFFYYAEPTPGKENGENGYKVITSPPEASAGQGVYNGIESLTVSLSGEGEIRYTLDGSVPTAKSPEYTEPFELTETTVIRAVCMEEGKLTGAPSTFSYIINEDDELPVVSLVCDPKEMFGYDGVYHADRVNHAATDADVSFFDKDGTSFSRMCQVELHGTATRKTYDKKSLELKFSSRYGGNLEYDVFKDGKIDSYNRLVLRGGNLTRLDLLKDSFVANLMMEICPETFPLNTRYTVTYINGEYYGIYAWREAYSEEYFEKHTGFDRNNILIDRSPLRSGEIFDIISYAMNNGMADGTKYGNVGEKLDMESLARWFAIEAYLNNRGINANVRYVRLSPESRWQMVLFDLDYSCTSEFDGQLGWQTVRESNQIGYACDHLIKNDEFRQVLLNVTADLYQRGFTTEKILSVLNKTIDDIPEADARKDCSRWQLSYDKWVSSYNSMIGHMTEGRYSDWLNGLAAITKTDKSVMEELFPLNG